MHLDQSSGFICQWLPLLRGQVCLCGQPAWKNSGVFRSRLITGRQVHGWSRRNDWLFMLTHLAGSISSRTSICLPGVPEWQYSGRDRNSSKWQWERLTYNGVATIDPGHVSYMPQTPTPRLSMTLHDFNQVSFSLFLSKPRRLFLLSRSLCVVPSVRAGYYRQCIVFALGPFSPQVIKPD